MTPIRAGRLSWLRILVDGAVLALLTWALVDLCRTALLGPERSAPWVFSAPGALVSLGIALHLAGRMIRHRKPRAAASCARAGLLLLAALAFLDAGRTWAFFSMGGAHTDALLPTSFLFGAILCAGALAGVPRRPHFLLQALVVAAFLPMLVVAHLFTFGSTDYRRPADAALVFGAKVDSRGRPSVALYDRTVTGCRLYETGLVTHLVLSGGRNPAVPLSEPEVMARIARARGIPASALILDASGRNTLATLENARRLVVERGWDEVLAVSHDVHLARVRLLARRTGIAVRTVPAQEPGPWPMKVVFITRELAAWTWWYVRSVVPARRSLSLASDASTVHRRRLFAR